MEHTYENNIKCPYCDYEEQDSWEYKFEGSESQTIDCGSCGESFLVERHVEVTYSSRRIPCDETGQEHDYKAEHAFCFKREHINREWFDLPEHKWKYSLKNICTKCDEIQYQDITKEEYENHPERI